MHSGKRNDSGTNDAHVVTQIMHVIPGGMLQSVGPMTRTEPERRISDTGDRRCQDCKRGALRGAALLLTLPHRHERLRGS